MTDAMHADASPWAWPVEVFTVHDETDKLVTSNGKLDEAVRKAVEAFNEQAEAPRNAGLDYDSGGSRFVVRAETVGTALDADKVAETVNAAVAAMGSSATLRCIKQPTRPTISVWRRRPMRRTPVKADFAEVGRYARGAGECRCHRRLGACTALTVGVDEGWWQPGCRIWLRRAAPTKRVRVRARRRLR
ncbi:MAG: hypothetical protein ACLTMP_10340 [Eggerthella lenta]